MKKVNFSYLPTTSPGANDVNVAANESEDLDLGSDKWMKDLARADLDQCDSIYASAKKKPEISGQTQGYRPDDIKYAVSCRLLDMVQMLEYANGLQEKSGLALVIRPNHLAEALASIRPIEQENRASIFQYFCRTRENFGAILNPERRSVQDLIERLNFQMALGPPPDVVRTVLSRTNFEAREKALANIPGAQTPFLELSVQFLRVCHILACRDDGQGKSVAAWEEVGRMLQKVYGDIWQEDSSAGWRRAIKQAWLNVHPDRNAQQNIFEMVPGKTGLDGLGSGVSPVGKSVDEQKNHNAALIGTFLDLTQQLSRVDGFFENIADSSKQSERILLAGHEHGSKGVVRNSITWLDQMHTQLSFRNLDKNYWQSVHVKKPAIVSDAWRGAAEGSKYNPAVFFLGRGIGDYGTARTSGLLALDFPAGVINYIFGNLDNRARALGQRIGRVIGGSIGSAATGPCDNACRGGYYGACVLGAPFWATGLVIAMVTGCISLVAQGVCCLVGACIGIVAQPLHRAMMRRALNSQGR